ncbi:MAG TPA: MarR family transcriptional regulator [Acidimicrobiales bacterium]
MAPKISARRRRSLEKLQKSVAIVAFRAKAISVQEGLGARVGFPLHGPYYATLSRIGRAKECTPSELAELLEYEPSTVSRRVRSLEERGLVARTTDPDDRRSYRLRLTPLGDKVFDALNEGWLEMLDEMVQRWTLAELEEFATHFEQFATAFEHLAARTSRPPSRSLLELWDDGSERRT